MSNLNEQPKVKYLFISNSEAVKNFIPKFPKELEISQWYLEDICLFASDEFTEVKNLKTGENLTDFKKVMVMSAPEELRLRTLTEHLES